MSGGLPTNKMDETKRMKKTPRRESKRPSIDMDSASAAYWKEKYQALEEKMAALRASHSKRNLELGLTEEELKVTREDLEDVEMECIDLKLDLEEVEQVSSRLEKRNNRLRKHMAIVEKENFALQTQIVKLSGDESGLYPPFEEEEEDEEMDFGELDTLEIDDDTQYSRSSTRTSDQESEENTTRGLWAGFVDEMESSRNLTSGFSKQRSKQEMDSTGTVQDIIGSKNNNNKWIASECTTTSCPELESSRGGLLTTSIGGNDKDQIIVVYCASGRRAAKAKQVLESKGYTHVLNAGGLKDLEYLRYDGTKYY